MDSVPNTNKQAERRERRAEDLAEQPNVNLVSSVSRLRHEMSDQRTARQVRQAQTKRRCHGGGLACGRRGAACVRRGHMRMVPRGACGRQQRSSPRPSLVNGGVHRRGRRRQVAGDRALCRPASLEVGAVIRPEDCIVLPSPGPGERTFELNVPARRCICTGDVVAYCVEPEEPITAIRDWGCHIVAGNGEEQLAAGAADCGCGFAEGTECGRLAKGWCEFANSRISADHPVPDPQVQGPVATLRGSIVR
jgi:hypothetical protein